MWSNELTQMILAGIGETLYMTLISTLLGLSQMLLYIRFLILFPI